MTQLNLPDHAINRQQLLQRLIEVLPKTSRVDPLYKLLCRPARVELFDIMYGGSNEMARPAEGTKWLEELHLPIRHLRRDLTFWKLLQQLHVEPSYWLPSSGLTKRGQGFLDCLELYAALSPEPD